MRIPAVMKLKLVVEEVDLRDFIRHRKVERKAKAEEKRQVDLQRIRDMRSTAGIDPLQLCAKEIWTKIFDELEPEDRGNVVQVHPLFFDLLEKNRIRDILLPQVIRLIHTQFRHTHLRFYFNDNLRLISKSVMNSFDRWIEVALHKSIQDQQCNSSPYLPDTDVITLNFNLSYNEDEDNEVKRLLARFGSAWNRFFPRGLSVSLSEFDMEITEENPVLMNQFKTDITTLLTRIGKDIWHFRFFLSDLESITFSSSDVYTLLKGWLSLMPNVKWIELSIQPSSQLIDIDEKESLGLLPFPHLAHLERLTFHSPYRHGESERFHNIYGLILGANQHIKMLDLNYGIDWDDKKENHDLPHVPAHLLQSLQLERFTVCDEDYDERNTSAYITKIEPIINCKWKLQTLVLSLTSKSYSDSMIAILQMLHHFPTLKKVRFNQLEEFTIGDTDKLGYLDLPNLEDFHVEITSPKIDFKSNIHFFFSLQFLVKCKGLKKVFWKMVGFNDTKILEEHLQNYENENYGEMIDFRGGMKNLYYSNLWHVFPYLDTVHVEIGKEKEEISYQSHKPFCRHEYMRAEVKSMTTRKFWKSHWCSRYNAPESCVL